MPKGINIDVAFSAMIGFTYLYNWLGGRRLVRFLCGFFSIAFLIFYAVVTDAPSGFVNYAFYLFGDLWSTVWVATFWALLNEISTTEQSARLYGLIGTGGILGGIAGSALVSGTVQDLQLRAADPALLGIHWQAIFVLSWRIDALAKSRGAAMAYHEHPVRLEKITWLSALDGARMVVRSRYLIAIVAILALYEFCSQILDFQFSSVLAKAIVGGRDVQAYLGQLYLVTNILALLSQIVLTTLLLAALGPRSRPHCPAGCDVFRKRRILARTDAGDG